MQRSEPFAVLNVHLLQVPKSGPRQLNVLLLDDLVDGRQLRGLVDGLQRGAARDQQADVDIVILRGPVFDGQREKCPRDAVLIVVSLVDVKALVGNRVIEEPGLSRL